MRGPKVLPRMRVLRVLLLVFPYARGAVCEDGGAGVCLLQLKIPNDIEQRSPLGACVKWFRSPDSPSHDISGLRNVVFCSALFTLI